MKKLLIISLLLIATNAIADIDVTGKFVPKNDGFTGIVDGDQVLCSEAANMLPAACYAVTYTNYTLYGTITNGKWCTGDAAEGTINCTEDAPAGGGGGDTDFVYFLEQGGMDANDETDPVTLTFNSTLFDTLLTDNNLEVFINDTSRTYITEGHTAYGWGDHAAANYEEEAHAADHDAAAGGIDALVDELFLDIAELPVDTELYDDDEFAFADGGTSNDNKITYANVKVELEADGFSALGSTIGVTELEAEDFGDFTCTGVTCTVDGGYVTSESDPQVGAVTNAKWCIGDGSAVQCTEAAPAGGAMDIDALAAVTDPDADDLLVISEDGTEDKIAYSNFIMANGDNAFTETQTTETLDPSADSTYDLGSAAHYYANTYTDKMYLNSTASVDGSTAGLAKVASAVSISGIYTFDPANAGNTSIELKPTSTNKLYDHTALHIDSIVTPSASGCQENFTGVGGYVHVAGPNFASPATMYGLNFTNYAGYTLAGTFGAAYGVRAIGMTAYQAGVSISAGTVYGVYAASWDPTYQGAITVSSAYGVYVAAAGDKGTGGTITNDYGVYIANPSKGTNNYQLFLTGYGAGSGIFINSTNSRLYNSSGSNLATSISGTDEFVIAATEIDVGSANTDRVDFMSGSDGGAPTCTADTTPSTCRYGADTSWLATPAGWLNVKIAGTAKKIPYY